MINWNFYSFPHLKIHKYAYIQINRVHGIQQNFFVKVLRLPGSLLTAWTVNLRLLSIFPQVNRVAKRWIPWYLSADFFFLSVINHLSYNSLYPNLCISLSLSLPLTHTLSSFLSIHSSSLYLSHIQITIICRFMLIHILLLYLAGLLVLSSVICFLAWLVQRRRRAPRHNQLPTKRLSGTQGVPILSPSPPPNIRLVRLQGIEKPVVSRLPGGPYYIPGCS